eukprot:maker-scaffold_8-snap-gene-11.40-mRNA-1 protein AED:0.00 eAED:0.00 QI:120/1/1/1/1/1/2/145/657
MTTARALYAFQGTEKGDLSFKEDAIIRVLRQDESGWWEGQTDDGRRGDFPYNYVELISPEEERQHRQGSALSGINPNPYNSNQQAQTDKINKIRVIPQDNTSSFIIEVILSRKKISQVKQVGDFRELDETLRTMYPNFDRPLPPAWADKVSLPGNSVVNSSRARVLEVYLRKLLNNEPAEYTLVTWLDPRETFNVSDPSIGPRVENARQQAGRGFGRNSVSAAIDNVSPLARVKFDWNASDAVELTIAKGDIVAIKNKYTPSKGWWEGETIDGQRGLFPANYVEALNPNEAQAVVTGQLISASGAQERGYAKRMTGVQKQQSGFGSGYLDNMTGFGPMGTQGNGKKYATAPSGNAQRKRRTIEGFAMPTLDAFDELLTDGFTMLTNGERNATIFVPKNGAKAPAEGDKVTISYAAYVWDSQKQRLIEFAASDLPGENDSGDFMRFIVGKGTAIKGLERAVQNLEVGQQSRIVVKPELAYGEVGNPPNVPPNCHLVYDIKLENFERASMPGPPSASGPSNQYNNMSSYGGQGQTQGALAQAVAASASKYTSGPVWQNNTPVGPRVKKPSTYAQRPPLKVQQGPSGTKYQQAPLKKYDLQTIRKIVETKAYEQFEVNPASPEDHLHGSAFEEAFGVDRPTFLLMQKWKRAKLKKEAGLH